jgi:nucleolar protein 15
MYLTAATKKSKAIPAVTVPVQAAPAAPKTKTSAAEGKTAKVVPAKSAAPVPVPSKKPAPAAAPATAAPAPAAKKAPAAAKTPAPAPVPKAVVAGKGKAPVVPKGKASKSDFDELTNDMMDHDEEEEEDSDGEEDAEVKAAPSTEAVKSKLANLSSQVASALAQAPQTAQGAAAASAKPTGVIYIGHLPFGFFEEEMRKFLSQFGTVLRLKLSRNKKVLTTTCTFCRMICFNSFTLP